MSLLLCVPIYWHTFVYALLSVWNTITQLSYSPEPVVSKICIRAF
jgi:hypothetical protein